MSEDLVPVGAKIRVNTHDYDPDIYGRTGTVEQVIPGRACPYHIRLDGSDFPDTVLFMPGHFDLISLP